MNLATLLTGLVTGVLTVPVVRYILLQFPGATDSQKNWAAILLSFVLGLLGFGVQIWLGYAPLPAELGAGPGIFLPAWFDALWPVLAAAYTASQVVFQAFKSQLK